MPIIDDAAELSKPQKQQIRRYCAPVAADDENDLAKFSAINSGMKNKSKQDQWLMQSTD